MTFIEQPKLYQIRVNRKYSCRIITIGISKNTRKYQLKQSIPATILPVYAKLQQNLCSQSFYFNFTVRKYIFL
jgi:hypothetical protein